MSLIKNVKKNRPSISVALLKQLGFPGLVNSIDADLGFENLLEKIMFAAGLNHIIQVNDCEDSTGYTESDSGTFDFETFASTGHRVGSNCLLMTATLACDNSQYVQLINIDESLPIAKRYGKRQMDWTDTRFLGFWVHNAGNAGDFGTEGELQIALVCDGGVVQTKVKVQAIVNTVHQWFEIDMIDAGWDLTKVESLRFYSNNTNATEVIFIDDILRYQISYCSKPYYGCSIPIKPDATITNGQLVRWTIDGAIPFTGSAHIADVGHAYLYGNSTLVGNAKRNKWVMVPGMHIGLLRVEASVTAGFGLETTDGILVEVITAGGDEKGFAKALEGADDKYDDIFVLSTFGATDV